jgi:hypothetical protein
LALVRRAFTLLDYSADLSDLERAAAEFDTRVAQVLAADPKVAEYVRQLEERDAEEDEEEDLGGTEALPSGEELIRELERFLREQRRERGED